MKRISILIMLILLLTACKPTYTVTFIDDDETILTVKVRKGEPLGDVEDPVKEGYIFKERR